MWKTLGYLCHYNKKNLWNWYNVSALTMHIVNFLMQFDKFFLTFFKVDHNIINVAVWNVAIRNNFVKGFCTSTRAYITVLLPSAIMLWFVCTSTCAKPFPKIIPMAKLDNYVCTAVPLRETRTSMPPFVYDQAFILQI